MKLVKCLYINVLMFCFAFWHGCCIILTSGSFTFLCQPLRDVLHKLRMTHKKVPAVQLLIIAMLYQPGRNVELGTALFLTKPGLCLLCLYSSSFVLQVRWPHLFTPVTYLSKLQGIPCVAAFLQLELFRAYGRNIERFTQNKRTHN